MYNSNEQKFKFADKGYLKSYGDKIPPIQKRMGGYFHDNDVLV
jgi:hypothetical protein